jgi:hypothetical protein
MINRGFQQRVTVVVALGHIFTRNITARAGTILDDNGLRKTARQTICHNATHHIESATWCGHADESHRFRWIAWRTLRTRYRRHNDSDSQHETNLQKSAQSHAHRQTPYQCECEATHVIKDAIHRVQAGAQIEAYIASLPGIGYVAYWEYSIVRC